MLIRQPRPVEVVQQSADVPAAEYFPNQRNTPAPVTEHSGVHAPPLHRAAGSPEYRAALPGANPHLAAPWHSAGPLPDSDSCPPGAPGRPLTSVPSVPRVTVS